MKIKKAALLKALESIKPGLAKKQIIESDKDFIFTGNDVLTYNSQMSIFYPFETDFKCSVPSFELYNIIKNIKEDEIEISVLENKLNIKSEKTKANISISKAEKISEIISSLDLNKIMENLLPLPKKFLEGIELCLLSASNDLTKPSLSSILIKNNLIMSSDSFRISKFDMDESIEKTFYIPINSAIELIKLPVVDYCYNENFIFFSTKEDVLFFCQAINPEIIYNYEDFFDNFKGINITLPNDISEMIKSSSVFSEGDFTTEKMIQIKILKNEIKCKGENGIGWIESSSKIDFNSDIGINFSINPEFFSKILQYSTKISYQKGKILFSMENFSHLIALMGE
jgi:hypothetical protein